QMNTLDDRRLLQTFPTGLICCSKEEHLPIRRMNEKLLSMLDYETVKDYNRYTGNLLMTSIHPEDIPKFRAYVQALTEGEEVDDICVRLRKRDYSYLPVQIFGGNLGDAWIVFACVDYSEQQERLDNLKEKSRKLADLRDDYRVLIDNLPSGFHRCALHDPIHIDYVSDNFCQMTGYTHQDIHEKMKDIYLEMVLPEDRHLIIDSITSLMQYPHTVQTVYRLQRKDGRVIRVFDRMRSVRHSDGKMWGYSIVVDVDEHPLEAGEMKKEPEKSVLKFPKTANAHTVEIHTFGYFEVLVDNKPIAFRSAKARELLAILVDRKENFTSREAIISMLWENETVNPATLTRCRKTFMNLMTELKEYGIEDILETQNSQRRIVPEKVNCDLFEYQKGDPQAIQRFRGEYMNEYSWSEITLSSLMPDEF
ncbi:MAG: PAS domain-containing protein, partial [Eubacteriales bacterium]|nr:PAS domain-containing protein [Eubacteriales bacterium]